MLLRKRGRIYSAKQAAVPDIRKSWNNCEILVANYKLKSSFIGQAKSVEESVDLHETDARCVPGRPE
jgi:hypothetical protein